MYATNKITILLIHPGELRSKQCHFLLIVLTKICKYVVIAVVRSAAPVILPLKEKKAFGECPKVSKKFNRKFKLNSTFPKYIVL